MSKGNLLLVEDDQNFGTVLSEFLEMNEYRVTWAHDGEEGAKIYKPMLFDLCILDVMMPKKDGFTLANEIRREDKNQPIIFLTAKSMKEDILRGYKMGADDYLTKPFDSEVLLLKIKAVLTRVKNALPELDTKESYAIGRYTYDSKFRMLKGPSGERQLSPKEGALLTLLCQFKNDLLPRSLALKKIWKDDNYFTGRSMDVYITKLRKYFQDDPSIEITNVHSEGFQLNAR
jgi:DNA-binding response OmpR family regulator